MRVVYITIAVTSLSLLPACKSIEKLVDNGKYDEAFDLAINKLESHKSIKTKHLVALEDGVNRINSRDLKKLSYLKGEEGDEKWDDVVRLVDRIEERQRRLDLLLPITSRDGYTASFDFIDVRNEKQEAVQNAAKYHYSRARHLMNEYDRLQNRALARAAYDALERVRSLKPGYENMEEMSRRAYLEGVSHVLLKWDQTAYDRLPVGIHQDMLLEAKESQDKWWVKFHDVYDSHSSYDVLVSIVVDEVALSPDREDVSRTRESRVFHDAGDRVPPQDSVDTGNSRQGIKTEEEQIVETVEITRTKRVDLRGRFEMRDYRTGKLLDAQTFELGDDFYSSAVEEAIYRGKGPGEITNSYTGVLQAFPSDYQMLSRALLKLKSRFSGYLHHIRAV